MKHKYRYTRDRSKHNKYMTHLYPADVLSNVACLCNVRPSIAAETAAQRIEKVQTQSCKKGGWKICKTSFLERSYPDLQQKTLGVIFWQY